MERPPARLSIEHLEARLVPTAGTSVRQSFDQAARGALPPGWEQWGNGRGAWFAASTGRALDGPGSLAGSGSSSATARSWAPAAEPADVQVSAAVYLDSMVPAQVIARGSHLDGATPTYYALSARRGLYVQLLRVVDGVVTPLADLSSAGWFADGWVQLTLRVDGSRLEAQVYRADTRQYLNASARWQAAPAWVLNRTDKAIRGGSLTGLGRGPGYAGTVYFDNFSATPLYVGHPSAGGGSSRGGHSGGSSGGGRAPGGGGGSSQGGPSAPQHYSWIRLAELAYSGITLGAFEDQLLRTSVDLVIDDPGSIGEHIADVAPNTPQLGYINFSSLYGDLLTSWNAWADAHGVPREDAFLHVTRATPFSGSSPSSQPVNWFWAVYQGGNTPDFQDLSSQAHTWGSQDFSLGAAGESTYIAYPEKFNQINFTLGAAAGAGWSAVLEYPTGADAYGNPTAWATLRPLRDTTGGFTRSGRITFAPPSNWATASLNGSALMDYVRIRVVRSGQAPVVDTVLGDDYVGANGRTRGVIPSPGAADFAYQTRLFYGSYGQMRFATNPANPYFRQWAASYAQQYLAAHPYSRGLFVDNSLGSPLAEQAGVAESLASYSAEYGLLLKGVGQAIGSKLVLANTAGGGTQADGVVSQVPGYYEEFGLRPLSGNFHQFENLAGQVAHRAGLQSPPPYAVLDSLPAGGAPTDSRTQLATLAEYYLLADPHRTFLDFYGGYAPSSPWAQHWSPAVTYDVGQPSGSWYLFGTGTDPVRHGFAYRVYARQYSNALVLYKPLSTNPSGTASGSTGNNTATVERLGATYRPLRADGTLGAPVTSVSLRNGEGAILIKV
jgi:hypothetical protein